jgi:hypothetical protein
VTGKQLHISSLPGLDRSTLLIDESDLDRSIGLVLMCGMVLEHRHIHRCECKVAVFLGNILFLVTTTKSNQTHAHTHTHTHTYTHTHTHTHTHRHLVRFLVASMCGKTVEWLTYYGDLGLGLGNDADSSRTRLALKLPICDRS